MSWARNPKTPFRLTKSEAKILALIESVMCDGCELARALGVKDAASIGNLRRIALEERQLQLLDTEGRQGGFTTLRRARGQTETLVSK